MKRRAEGDAEHNKIVSSSKIMLDKTRAPDMTGGLSARVYRTLAAGGFLLMRDIAGLEKQFQSGRHLDTFKTTEECLKKIDKYLDRPYTMKSIKDTGREEVLKNHTWEKRIEQLIKLI